MSEKILNAIVVWMIAGTVMSGCGAYAAEETLHESDGQAVSAAELEEDMQEWGRDVEQAECGNGEMVMEDGEKDNVSRMLRINGEIYYDTGRVSTALRCGVMDWIIESTVPEGEIPTRDNQSNFGTDYGYQRWSKGQVHVNIDGAWHVFQASEAYRLTATNGNNGELVELERSPAFWEIIEKYQNLDVTSQNKPADKTGYSYCLRLYDKGDKLLATVTPMGREVKLDGVYYSDNGYGTVAELQLALDALFEEDFPEATASMKVVAMQGETAQGQALQGESGKDVISEDIDTLEDVYMSVTYATDKGANLVLMNYSDKNMQCGDDYELQMLKEGEWYRVDYIIDNWAFNAIAYLMPKNEPVNICVDWTHFHGVLPVGQYRIVKSVMDFRGTGDYTTYRLAAEFEVK